MYANEISRNTQHSPIAPREKRKWKVAQAAMRGMRYRPCRSGPYGKNRQSSMDYNALQKRQLYPRDRPLSSSLSDLPADTLPIRRHSLFMSYANLLKEIVMQKTKENG